MDQDELQLAAKLYYSFLPDTYSNERLDIAVKSRPLDTLGGDYCSIFPVDEHSLIVCICDAVGHGLASAFFAARINAFVLSQACNRRNPCALIESLNEFLCRRLPGTGMYATFFAVFLDLERNEIEFSGAAHPPALLHRKGENRIDLLESCTTMLGIAHPMPLQCLDNRRKWRSGDRIVLYTDGLPEARGPGGQAFGRERLIKSIREYTALNSVAFNERLMESVLRFSGGKIKDDILLMNILAK